MGSGQSWARAWNRIDAQTLRLFVAVMDIGIEMRGGGVANQRFMGHRVASIIRPRSVRTVDVKPQRGSQGMGSASRIEIFRAHGLSSVCAQRNDPVSTRAEEKAK